MGAATILRKGWGLLDDAIDAGRRVFDPEDYRNVQEMTAQEIMDELDNVADLPGWRRTDLERQLPSVQELEELQAIRTQADDTLTDISTRGRDDVPTVSPANHNPETNPLNEKLWEDFFNPKAKRPERFDVEPLDPDLDYKPKTVPSVTSSTASLFSPTSRRAMRNAAWANPAEMQHFKDLAKQLEEVTGVAMDVDHYIPLQGKYVSGLNHQDNLFVMPATQNRRKGNSFNYEDYKTVPSSAFRLTGTKDHDAFLRGNRDIVNARAQDKALKSQSMSNYLDHQIIDPSSQLGKNAKELWGRDYEKYADDIRGKLNLLGV